MAKGVAVSRLRSSPSLIARLPPHGRRGKSPAAKVILVIRPASSKAKPARKPAAKAAAKGKAKQLLVAKKPATQKSLARKATSKTRAPAAGRSAPKAKAKGKVLVTAKPVRPAKPVAKPLAKKTLNGKHVPPRAVDSRSRKGGPSSEQVQSIIHQSRQERERWKDLSQASENQRNGKGGGQSNRDRAVLLVRDPFWLQACWNVTRSSVKRAEAALAEQWHAAIPVMRLLEVDAGTTTSSSERVARELEIHGGVTNWYIDVSNPPHSYRVEIGYKGGNGKFFGICRSNIVTTPTPGSCDAIDGNWTDVAENYEKIYALSGGYAEDNSPGELQELFEERLRRPMGPSLAARFGLGAENVIKRPRDFKFDVDAEMILFGHTKPDARVTLAGEPIKLQADGSFTIRLAMPDKRQVLPVVASSVDGVEQRTVVIAVERNTKVLEPMLRESNNSSE